MALWVAGYCEHNIGGCSGAVQRVLRWMEDGLVRDALVLAEAVRAGGNEMDYRDALGDSTATCCMRCKLRRYMLMAVCLGEESTSNRGSAIDAGMSSKVKSCANASKPKAG